MDRTDLLLLDHHCHAVAAGQFDRTAFETLLTEAASPGPPGVTRFDSRIGFALRRWCPPVLDLPRHASPDDYLARRWELGGSEVARRFLRGARLAGLCVDTGYAPPGSLDLPELAAAADAPAREVVRLESVAEECAVQSGATAASFADLVAARLEASCATAVAVKSIAGYRVGLALSGQRPTRREIVSAAGRWLSTVDRIASVRLAEQVLHRFLIWTAVDLAMPIQVHVGYGDADLDLWRANPLLLTGLLRAIEPTGVPVVLLHNYPYQRYAGYLAQIFDNVYLDIGLAVHNVGDRAPALLAETMELAPFGKILYSSDACGLPELYYLAARLFRRALERVLAGGVVRGEWSAGDASRIADLLARENAERVYRLANQG